jgi:hypothetical protein
MKMKIYCVASVLVLTCAFMFFAGIASAQKKIPDTVTLKLQGAMMAPVTFSHITHTQKTKIDCASCHHKDKDPKEALSCRTCHQVTGTNNGAPPGKDVFHLKCQTCHKESSAKGVKAPTLCTECHKK